MLNGLDIRLLGNAHFAKCRGAKEPIFAISYLVPYGLCTKEPPNTVLGMVFLKLLKNFLKTLHKLLTILLLILTNFKQASN